MPAHLRRARAEFVADARELVEQAGLEDRIELVEADGATYELGRYDAALCIGATFVYGGLVPTIERLRQSAPLHRGRRAVLAHLAAAARA